MTSIKDLKTEEDVLNYWPQATCVEKHILSRQLGVLRADKKKEKKKEQKALEKKTAIVAQAVLAETAKVHSIPPAEEPVKAISKKISARIERNENSLGMFLIGLSEIVLGGTIMAGGFALEVVTVGGFTIGLGATTSAGAALMGHGLGLSTTAAWEMSNRPRTTWKNSNAYVPDRPLPREPGGHPKPDVNAPHTQLGTADGRHGTYPQAREFDKDGKWVRDIDFTDHCRPQNHPCPHQHEYIPNPTGGTPERDPIGKEVPEWNYQ